MLGGGLWGLDAGVGRRGGGGGLLSLGSRGSVGDGRGVTRGWMGEMEVGGRVWNVRRGEVGMLFEYGMMVV